ncbi:MraY family glycosyltransferase [Clostridium thermarum]|uniref:MraY family glycosyltransferase n=1 Tax=Clostridium thermarum TaxID=1716543 RepID=UPI0011244680|nr:MraY family glycosyltransferase [Clostridium thermarum]
MDNLFLLSFIAAITSFFITPLIRKAAYRYGVLDIPRGKRKIHKKPIPLLGGLAIYIPFIILVVAKAGVINRAEWGIILGGLIIVIGGVLDDKWELRPCQKLLFQLMASMVLIIMGLRIEMITNPFGSLVPYIDIGFLSIPFTVIWVIGITNALNLIDGLDGLAAGIALISTLTILLIAIMKERIGAAYLTAILSGAIAGFLPYNFNPASIFLGDTGAQLLGFLLAAISIEGAIKSATIFSIIVPIFIIGIPIFDTLFAIVRRKINGKPIMQADRGHLHHRLLDMGLTQKQAVLVMYVISIVLSMLAIVSIQIDSSVAYYLLTFIIFIIILVCWKLGFFKHRE